MADTARGERSATSPMASSWSSTGPPVRRKPSSSLEILGNRKGDVMAVQLNHTIVSARDKRVSADFLAEILGVGEPKPFGPFLGVAVDNDVTLDFVDWSGDGDLARQHYAFLVSEAEFDEIFGRIQARNLDYWADPHHDIAEQIN